ncbi:hypothetical protein E3J95_03845 [Candidatus Aerophobetes bacterium]|uniref:Uncharacterized protein n=1 Tax=Aerophobetes bacterium TaxID=2030807 RepID=A0A523QJ64_UNCAE|nr:MAG: hypothetical protein E3J95_03845 [Candidatus Aerophobetes bacterium]
MPFKRFDVPRRTLAQPAVTIVKGSGKMWLNSPATKYFGKFRRVAFFWDQERRTIGLRPTNAVAGTAVLSRRRKGGGASISAKTFLSHYGLFPWEKRVIEIAWNEKEKLLELDLEKKPLWASPD